VGIRLLIGSLILVVAAATTRGVELMPGPRALTEAVDIGQSRIGSLRTKFHEPYRLHVQRAPVDYIDVVTPFRRVVLAAEAGARRGDRMFGQREARAALAESPGQIDLRVELTFHPQNTFIGVPAYQVRLLPAIATTASPEARDVSYVPRFGPRIEGVPLPFPYPTTSPGLPGGGQPLTGGTIVVRLDGATLDPNGLYDVLVVDGKTELARSRLDLRALR
jgi:hypothetical protein